MSDTPGSPPTTLVLVAGLPGAGKTTAALTLAERHRAIRMCPDEWLLELGLDPYDEPLRDRLEGAQWRQAQQLLALGVSIVIEFGFWSRAERDRARQTGRDLGVRVELCVLDVGIDERWRRIAQRNDRSGVVPITRAQLESWETYWQPPTPDELALFDPPAEAGRP